MRKTQILLLVIILNTINTVKVLSYDKFTNLSLSNRCTLMSAKSDDGFIWFATRNGINRFDGETYKFYELKKDNNTCDYPKGIISKKNMIYVYSEEFIYYYSYTNDSFIKTDIGISLKNNYINTMCIDNYNTLWVGTNNNLLYKLYNNKKTFIAKKNIQINCIQPDQTRIILGTSNGIINLSCQKCNNVLNYKLKTLLKIKIQYIQSFYYNNITKDLWIGTFSDGILLYNTTKKKLIHLYRTSQPIRSITSINKNKIWIGIDGEGIFEYNPNTRQLENKYTQDNYIKVNNIYHILNDHKYIYVCTYTSGVFIYNKNELVKKLFSNENTSKQKINNNHINTIFQDNKKRIWFGTNNGISRYNPSNDSWKNIIDNNAIILTINEDNNNRVWAGGFGHSSYYIDSNDNIKQIKNNYYRINQKYINTIYKENDNIWFGGNNNFLLKYNTNNESFKTYPIKYINNIKSLNKDSLIITTNNRVIFINKLNDKFTDIKLPLKSTYYFQCISIIPQYKDIIWIGTEGEGIIKYNYKTNKCQIFNESKGILSNSICSLQYDLNGNLWIGGENGLYCLNPTNNNIRSYSTLDGLPTNTHCYRSSCLLDNGNLIFGTPCGAYEIEPNKLNSQPKLKFNLRFEDFSIFNVSIIPGKKSVLKEIIDKTNNITLKHIQHSFSFNFKNIEFNNVSKSLYSWYLEGFDKTWKTPSEQHYAVYTNIQPGDYIFHVRAYDMGNSNNYQERTINIKILQPWYNTCIAWFIYVSIIILIAYYIFKFYKNKLEAKDSDQKIRFFVNIAHDIRTPLTLIKAPLNEIEEEEKLSDNGKMALNLAQRNIKKLLNIVNQLLDFQKIEREAMKLQIEESNIYTLISNIISNFEPLANEKSISLHKVFSFENTIIGYIDQYKMSIILDNLISNAIKYTNNNGNVWIKCSIDNNLLNISIIDDGIGISINGQKNLFNRFYRAQNAENSKETGSGIGLLLTKKMIQLHKGNINFSSREGIGTTFSFSIPIDKNNYSKDELIKVKPLINDNIQTSLDNNDKNKYKLLIVEDNKELCDYLSHSLRDNYNIIESYNGEEGLEAIKKDSPDFIISDIMMPGISGLELCKKIKSNIETCHIPIILLTSLAEREDIIKGLDAGADDYITKPFEMPILKSKICGIIKNRQLFRKKYIDKSAFTNNAVGINELDKIFMSQVVDKIENEMTNEDFSIDVLATDMAMSRSVFFKKIKSLTGQSPQDLIRDLKMKKAATLLLERKYSIGEISYLTGYPNSKYFSTAFKKYYGKTPSGYVTDIINS